jgi:hypothetical protein
MRFGRGTRHFSTSSPGDLRARLPSEGVETVLTGCFTRKCDSEYYRRRLALDLMI